MGIIKKPLILVVDDTPENLKVLSNILHAKGYNISISTSGASALESVNTELPDLILLDIQMPEMDGYETFKALKNTNAKDIPVIFLTGYTESDKIVKAFELGAVDYITKPFNIPELTARVATHLEIKRSREKLIELNLTKEKLFSIISHDLKNSMGAALGLTNLLMKNIEDYPLDKIHDLLRHIQNSSKNTYELLENLLDWSRLQTGKFTENIEKYNLKTEVLNTCMTYDNSAREKNITLQNNITSDLFTCCDIDMTKTILRNLVSNAIKFTNPDGIVYINSLESISHVEIHITDTGVGIEPENISRLFSAENNISTPGTKGEKGTGLGLMLCKELVEKQHGEFWVESELGKGSTFKVALPKCEN